MWSTLLFEDKGRGSSEAQSKRVQGGINIQTEAIYKVHASLCTVATCNIGNTKYVAQHRDGMHKKPRWGVSIIKR